MVPMVALAMGSPGPASGRSKLTKYIPATRARHPQGPAPHGREAQRGASNFPERAGSAPGPEGLRLHAMVS
jgi:hypothetical protein